MGPITATAPVRICDLGGWTDTWFGGPGRIVNIAVEPRVSVTVAARAGEGARLRVGDDHYPLVAGEPWPGRHPLVEAAVEAWAPPAGTAFDVTVDAGLPPGCGAGTSAAVAVALVAALAAAGGTELGLRHVALEAHRLEVEVLGLESGVQDQLCAAFGGINYLVVDPYPDATVHRLPDWPELDDLLSLVYLGRPHDSSAIHRQVIEGPGAPRAAALDQLRSAAEAGRDAVIARDLAAFGRAMIDNTDEQAALHPALVGAAARAVIDAARPGGAIGWKVNGAGGDGGSITLLSPDPATRAALAATLGPAVIPIRLSPDGLLVSRT